MKQYFTVNIWQWSFQQQEKWREGEEAEAARVELEWVVRGGAGGKTSCWGQSLNGVKWSEGLEEEELKRGVKERVVLG